METNHLTLDLDGAAAYRDISDRVRAEWESRTWLAGGALRIPRSEWPLAGQPAESGSEPDEQEYWRGEWAASHDALCRSFGLLPEAWAFRLVGIFGVPSARLIFAVNGAEITASSHAPDGLPLRGDAPLLSPVASWVWTRIAAFPKDRLDQLRVWAEIRHHVDTLLPLLSPRISVSFSGHIERIVPEAPEKFSLRLEPLEGGRATVKARYFRPDGTEQEISYSDLDNRGLVVADANRPILLPSSVSEVLQAAAKQDRRPIAEVFREIADPRALVPEGIDGDLHFDLSHYSDRVAGFERVKKGDRPQDLTSSGVTWFDAETHSDAAFLTLIVQDGGTSAERRISLSDEDAAAKLLAANEKALQTGAATIPGFPFRPSESIRLQVASALQRHRAHQEDPHADQKPEPSGPVAAIVKDLEASPANDLDGPVIDESAVPWEALTRVLSAQVTLKAHQRRGIAWMWGHLQQSPGALLADDMGLGKTLQAACVLALRRLTKPSGTHLIVCPTVLIDNWCEELQKFFDGSVFGRVYKLHEANLSAAKLGPGGLDLELLRRHDLLLTNYETLARFQRSLLQIDFDLVIFDEAQHLKNPTTLKSRASRGLKRHFALALTGTPVENTLTDIWAIYDALQTRPPRSFGAREDFEKDYTKPGPAGIDKLRQRLRFPSGSSTLLRREKAEALRDLPPKRYDTRFTEMTAAQAEMESDIARSAGSRGALVALDQLRKLYQHPALLAPEAVRLSPDGALVQSPKTRLTLELLDEIREKGEKALVFTLWHQMQDLLVDLIKHRFKLPRVHVINGDLQQRRGALANIKDFGAQPGFNVMVLSPVAAGVGLTITAANHVIHYGRWWNPAKEDQATDRAYRIGQTKPVTVYYPTLHRPGRKDAGFDLRLHELLERKRRVARDFLAPASDLEISNEEVSVMLRQGV